MLYNILELKTNPFRHECSVLACRYWWDDKPCGRSGCDDNAVLQAGRAGKVQSVPTNRAQAAEHQTSGRVAQRSQIGLLLLAGVAAA